MVAVLGTTISPYLFFWQASHEVEEEKARGRRTVAQRRGATGARARRPGSMASTTGDVRSNLISLMRGRAAALSYRAPAPGLFLLDLVRGLPEEEIGRDGRAEHRDHRRHVE